MVESFSFLLDPIHPFGSSPNTRVIPSIVISHVLPDCRASFVWKRAGAFLYPVHACRTVMTAFPQRFAASVTVITSSSALTSITSQAMQYWQQQGWHSRSSSTWWNPFSFLSSLFSLLSMCYNERARELSLPCPQRVIVIMKVASWIAKLRIAITIITLARLSSLSRRFLSFLVIINPPFHDLIIHRFRLFVNLFRLIL